MLAERGAGGNNSRVARNEVFAFLHTAGEFGDSSDIV
jgi:hypothetical protein